MEYKIIGHLNVSDSPTVKEYLQSEKGLRRFETKTGKGKWRVREGVQGDSFSINAVYETDREALKVYNRIVGLMEFDKIPGKVMYHACNHEEGQGICSPDELFVYPPE